MKVVELSKSLTEKLRNSLPPQVVLNIACSVSRCECLYGLGCCFVSLGVSYGVYTVSQNEYLLVSQNAARNMAHQGILPPWGRLEEVASLNGSDLVGTLIGGSFADEAISIRLLPEIITTSIEGTGIRAGFPMEDVGDYLSFVTLRERLKDHEIQAGWLSQLPPTIIQTPTKSLPTPSEMCQKIDHSGPTDELLDSQELRNMAEMAAGEAYFHGRMLVGAHRGMPINEARELIKRSLLKSGQAFEYRQPSGPPETIGDCVVAYLEHWHLGLSSEGESRGSRWVRETCNFLNSSKFQHISVEGRTELHDAVQRLGSWAIGRGRGYGTQAPWDEALLIDPFTEAAIAPAYQTIAHFLHADMYGEILGLGVVRPEQMTDQVWDFVFSRLDIRSAELEKVTTDISHSTLCRMRLEFEWWYPTNLYVADKGQIQDHLVFFLCHHVALFVPKYWPRGARVSGEMLLEGKKMSGRQGHMVPAGRMIDKYGADAVRMAIARASTNLSMDDVEWDENIALDSMRRLYELKDYLEKLSKASCERSGAYQSSRGEAVNDGGRDGDLGVWDSSLMDEIQWIARKAGSCYER
jgi:leucyl-tRNA synthetase